MAALKLKDIGGATGVEIPEDMLARMGVRQGDTLFVVETPDGYSLSPRNPEIKAQLEHGREGMLEFQETFKRLAE